MQPPDGVPYEEDVRFRDVYLEDSYVLAVRIDAAEVVFEMEFVVTQEHAQFAPPLAGEQYCYRRGTLVFSQTSIVDLARQTRSGARDATGAIDYGNIDSFRLLPNGRYELEGDWGRLTLVAARVAVRIDD